MDEVTKALKFGDQVENIAASEDNPIKRGIFVRYMTPRMAEYVTAHGSHKTPADNLRLAAQSAAPVGEPERWKCGARQRHIGPEIQDCDWPVCGCDPYASKVLDAIDENGFQIVRRGASPSGSPVGWGDDYPEDQS